MGWCPEAGGTTGTASTYAPCSCAQILSKDCLNWSVLGVGAVRCRFSALPNFKTLRARATAKTAQGTRIHPGWVISEFGCLVCSCWNHGGLGRPGGQGVTWATYKVFNAFCGGLISRSNQKLHEKSEPMVLRSAGDSAIITTESQ